MPHDIVVGDVYLPSLLVAAVLSLIAASLTIRGLRVAGVMAWFANPPLVFISITVIYTVVLGSTLFPS